MGWDEEGERKIFALLQRVAFQCIALDKCIEVYCTLQQYAEQYGQIVPPLDQLPDEGDLQKAKRIQHRKAFTADSIASYIIKTRLRKTV